MRVREPMSACHELYEDTVGSVMISMNHYLVEPDGNHN